MECIDATKFAMYSQDMLSGKEKEDVEKHFSECSKCREDFEVANALLQENEVDLLSEDEIQAIWRKLKKEIAKVWARSLVADLIRKPWFVFFESAMIPSPVRSETLQPSIDHIHFKRDIHDLKTEMYFRKKEQDKALLKVRLPENKEKNDVVRITLKDEEGGVIASRALKDDMAEFRNLNFGVYYLVFYGCDRQWEYPFEISETGFDEKNGES